MKLDSQWPPTTWPSLHRALFQVRLTPTGTAFFILFTAGCADVLSLRIGSATVRLFYALAALLLVVSLQRIELRRSVAIAFLIFLSLLLPSLYNSIVPARSLTYLVWAAVTFLSSLACASLLQNRFSLGKAATEDCYELLAWCYRFQIVMALCLYAFGIHERPRFLYYEPSYFSISLLTYLAIVMHRLRADARSVADVTLLMCYLVASFSAAFAVGAAVLVCLSAIERRSFSFLLFLVSTFLVGCLYVVLVDDANTTIVRALVNGDAAVYDLALRGGNRMGRILLAHDVFLQAPYIGVGAGAYEAYISASSHEDYSGGIDYLSADGLPAINIYLELLATTGIVGFIGFSILLGSLLPWVVGRGFSSPLSKACIAILLVLNFESNYLRPYVWILFALCWAQANASVGGSAANTGKSVALGHVDTAPPAH